MKEKPREYGEYASICSQYVRYVRRNVKALFVPISDIHQCGVNPSMYNKPFITKSKKQYGKGTVQSVLGGGSVA